MSESFISHKNEEIFNSKLFLDLGSTFDYSSSNNSYEKDNDSKEVENINNDFLITKDLMDELDCPETNSVQEKRKEENFSDSLLSLFNRGYEFIPKGYQFNYIINPPIDNGINVVNKMPYISRNYIFNNSNEKKNFFNRNPVRHKIIIKRKEDWVCNLCRNLNFAFRQNCNRCKKPKEECMQKK